MGLLTTTATKTTAPTFNANLGDLPFLKHFDQGELVNKVDTFRKGEKDLFWFLKAITALGAIGAFLIFAVPIIFTTLGKLFAVGATVAFLAFSVLVAPAVFKGLRSLTRSIHKLVIKNDPFGQFADARVKMVENQQTALVNKGQIGRIKTEMELEAQNSEKEAVAGQTKILSLQGKAESIKAQMEEMVRTHGPEAKNEDAYVDLASEFQKVLAEAQRVTNKTMQAKDFIQKYGSRAAIMKKLGQRLTMVETAMDIKLSDFDATVEMLKKDFDFGQKANAATSAAKSALGFNKSWELDYALDVVASTIAADVAMTAGSLKDIESLTSNYTLDSDELFANLNRVADNIKVGQDIIPAAKKYSGEDYKLTQSDKAKSGGFGDLF